MKLFLSIIWIFYLCPLFAQVDDEINTPLKHLQQAERLYAKNYCGEALNYVNKTIAAQMNNWEAYQLRARIYQCLHTYDKAISDYSILLLWQPENREFLFSRGELRYKEKQYQLALEDLRKSLELPPQETNQVFFSSNPGENGISGITTMATMEAELYNLLGLCFHQLENYDSAIYSFSRAINQKKESRFLNNRALTFEAMGKWSEAVKDYEEALAIEPDNEMAKYNLAICYGKIGEFSKQEKLFQTLGRGRALPEIFVLKGVNAYQLEKYKLAVAYYDSAIQLDNSEDEYYIYRGQANEKAGENDQAINDFKKAIRLSSTNPSAYFGLGNTYYGINQLDSAKLCYDLAIVYDNTYYNAYLNRGICYLRELDLKNACKDLSFAMNGGLKEAKALFEKKCKNNGEHPDLNSSN